MSVSLGSPQDDFGISFIIPLLHSVGIIPLVKHGYKKHTRNSKAGLLHLITGIKSLPTAFLLLALINT